MSQCKAYEPQQGYRYQILVRYTGQREFESCDYAKDKEEKNYLLNEYRLAYRNNAQEFKTILLPEKYWNN